MEIASLTGHATHDVSKTSDSVRPQKNYDEPTYSKNATEGTVFENLRFCCPKTPFMCGRKAKTENEFPVFKNIRIRVDGARVQRP